MLTTAVRATTMAKTVTSDAMKSRATIAGAVYPFVQAPGDLLTVRDRRETGR